MIEVVDLRLNAVFNLNDEDFRQLILQKTNSIYEAKNVLRERTGFRNSRIEYHVERFSNLFLIQKKLFIVSALRRINPDKYTRYMVLIELESYDPEILDKIEDYVPVYLVNFKNSITSNNHASELSVWFRANMGRGFSFVDVDFLLYNSHFSLLIEEKIGFANINSIGYGQLISYKELITDVIKKPNEILFVFSDGSRHMSGEVDYFTCNIESFSGNKFANTPQIKRGQLADVIINYLK